MEEKIKYIANEVILEDLRTLLKEGHTVTIRARGYSMRPFVEHNRDSLRIAPLQRPIRIGDALLVRTNKFMRPKHMLPILTNYKPSFFRTLGIIIEGQMTYVLHRVIEIQYPYLLLQGDGNIDAQEICTVEDVIGIVDTVYRKGKAYPTSSALWKNYSRIWMKLRPIRRPLLLLYRAICKGEIGGMLKRLIARIFKKK